MTKSDRIIGVFLQVVTWRSSSSGLTNLNFQFDGQQMFGGATALNPTFPRTVKLGRVGLSVRCSTVNVGGDWTVLLRKNESSTNLASFDVPMTTVIDKDVHEWIVVNGPEDLILQPAESLWIRGEGPSVDGISGRGVLEFHIL